MQSAVLILPIELKEAGDKIGEAMGWGPVSYTIPLSSGQDLTHYGLRADVSQTFIDMIEAAKSGTYPDAIPESIIKPVVENLIADFSTTLWGYDHFQEVLNKYNMIQLS
jgi:hypothetical protein